MYLTPDKHHRRRLKAAHQPRLQYNSEGAFKRDIALDMPMFGIDLRMAIRNRTQKHLDPEAYQRYRGAVDRMRAHVALHRFWNEKMREVVDARRRGDYD